MLPDLQSQFVASLFAQDAAVTDSAAVDALVRGGKLSPSRRLAIYRHNVFTTLTGALRDLYPVTECIVGAPFFSHLAKQFIHATPSPSGDLNMFGREWPDFLAACTDADDLPYLHDVAALEWAWHMAFHAADRPRFDLLKLASVPPEQHVALRFTLHPSVVLIASSFPIVRIWEVNQPDYVDEVAINWEVPGDFVLVVRDDVEIKIQSVPRANFEFLRAIQNDASFDVAAEKAFEADADFDLQGTLLAAIQSNVIVDVRLDSGHLE